MAVEQLRFRPKGALPSAPESLEPFEIPGSPSNYFRVRSNEALPPAFEYLDSPRSLVVS